MNIIKISVYEQLNYKVGHSVKLILDSTVYEGEVVGLSAKAHKESSSNIYEYEIEIEDSYYHRV